MKDVKLETAIFFGLLAGAVVWELFKAPVEPGRVVAFALGMALLQLEAHFRPASTRMGKLALVFAALGIMTGAGFLGLVLGNAVGNADWFEWVGRAGVGFAVALIAYNLLVPRDQTPETT